MKKLLLIVLALAFSLSLCACKGEEHSHTHETDEPHTETTAKEQKKLEYADPTVFSFDGGKATVKGRPADVKDGGITIPATAKDQDGKECKVVGVGELAFFHTADLQKIKFEGAPELIDYQAFAKCTALESLELPEGVKKLGDLSFFGCTSLRSVVISATVTEIGAKAFAECEGISSLSCLAEVPPTLGDGAFECAFVEGAKITVPASSVEAYKTATGWSELASLIEGK